MQADLSYDTYAERDPRIIPDNYNRWQLRFQIELGLYFSLQYFFSRCLFFLGIAEPLIEGVCRVPFPESVTIEHTAILVIDECDTGDSVLIISAQE